MMTTSYAGLFMVFFGLILKNASGCTVPDPVDPAGEMSNIREYLKADEAILAYTVTDSTLQVSMIARESGFNTVQSVDQSFWHSLKAFQRGMKSAEPRRFLIHGEILYYFLIRPVQKLITGKHRLIIIPGERLSAIPFEALVICGNPGADNDICNVHYLIHDFEIVYRSSPLCRDEAVTTRPSENPVNPGNPQYAFMGFSPAFKDNNNVTALPGTKNEIERIAALFLQKGLSAWFACDKSFGKDYFKTMAPRGKIVHLSTHCITGVDDRRGGGFLFSDYGPQTKPFTIPDGLLTKEEFNGMYLDASLIVLNSCASGIGDMVSEPRQPTWTQLLSGAGVRNILSTLWNITDNLAERFMLDFYRSCLSGKTYSEALREVKLQWINCSTTAMPTVWAPYVLTGE